MTAGKLYVVATPIGNLDDITLRALDVLRSVACVAAEDTRHSRKLLQHYGIDTPMMSLHEHNESERVAQVQRRLEGGESLALISDAGTPLISDPGYVLVRELRAHGCEVVPIPGPCAAIAAMSVAGLPSDRFLFAGFPPAKQQARRTWLADLLTVRATLVLYESPRRVLETLQDAALVFGESRLALLARELTKTYETILTGTLAELEAVLSGDPGQLRGEMVILVEPPSEVALAATVAPATLAALLTMAESMPLKQACKLVAELTDEPVKKLYQAALEKRAQ